MPLILSNIKNFESNEGSRKFEQGRQEALNKEQELLERLKQLPDGEQKVTETKRMIGLVRKANNERVWPTGTSLRIYKAIQSFMEKYHGDKIELGEIAALHVCLDPGHMVRQEDPSS